MGEGKDNKKNLDYNEKQKYLEIVYNELRASGLEVDNDNDLLNLIHSGVLKRADGTVFTANDNIDSYLEYIAGRNTAPESNIVVDEEAYNRSKTAEAGGSNVPNKKENSAETEFVESREELPGEQTVSAAASAERRPVEDPRVEQYKLQVKRMLDTTRTSVSGLFHELLKTDRFVWKNSPQFDELKDAFARLEERISASDAVSARDLNNAFLDKDEKGKSILDYVDAYVAAKTGQKDSLNSRQADRLSICERLKNIGSLLNEEQYRAGSVDFTKAYAEDRIAHKIILAKAKSVGNKAADRIFRDPDLYERLISDIKKNPDYQSLIGQRNQSINIISRESPSDILKRIDPAAGKAVDKLAARDIASLKDNDILKKGEPKLKALSEFLTQRSANMLKELEAENSFSHSKEYKAFKDSLLKFHNALTGQAENPQYDKDTLKSALSEIADAAKNYQFRHIGDDGLTTDTRIFKRLGIAAEIRLCNEYLKKNDSIVLDDLYTELYAHKKLQERLLSEKSRVNDDLISSKNKNIGSGASARLKQFEEHFRNLTDFEKYVRGSVPTEKNNLAEDDDALSITSDQVINGAGADVNKKASHNKEKTKTQQAVSSSKGGFSIAKR